MPIMKKRRTIVAIVACCLAAVITDQTLSQPPAVPPNTRGMTWEQAVQAGEQLQAQQEQRICEEELMLNEHWKIVRADLERRVLRIDRRQWQTIGPKRDRVKMLRGQAGFRMLTGVKRNMKEGRFYWRRISQNDHGRSAKTIDEMTECERIAEELVDLLEDKNAKDEVIKKKMDALEQARERAKRELAKARQELRELLNGPRQEAVLLIMRILE